MNLFYQPDIPDGARHLDREESHHAIRVMRMDKNHGIEITDGKGAFYVAKITKPEPKKCEFEIIEKREIAKRDFQIHIAIAPTKNADRIEWFVEKATEIGVDQISFLLCKNSERKVINFERLEKMAISAMKQSQQAWLPRLSEMIPFKEILSVSVDQKFIAHVDSSNPKQLRGLSKPKRNYLVLIGPEGDFSQEELELTEKANFEKVSLGPNRLRTETAGLVAVQILNFIQQG